LGVTVMPACYTTAGVVRPSLSGFTLGRRIGFLYAGHAEHLRHSASRMLDAIRERYTG
jgi:hypothetical protein